MAISTYNDIVEKRINMNKEKKILINILKLWEKKTAYFMVGNNNMELFKEEKKKENKIFCVFLKRGSKYLRVCEKDCITESSCTHIYLYNFNRIPEKKIKYISDAIKKALPIYYKCIKTNKFFFENLNLETLKKEENCIKLG